MRLRERERQGMEKNERLELELVQWGLPQRIGVVLYPDVFFAGCSSIYEGRRGGTAKHKYMKNSCQTKWTLKRPSEWKRKQNEEDEEARQVTSRMEHQWYWTVMMILLTSILTWQSDDEIISFVVCSCRK